MIVEPGQRGLLSALLREYRCQVSITPSKSLFRVVMLCSSAIALGISSTFLTVFVSILL